MTKEDRKRERFNKPHIQETVRLAQNFDKDEWNAVLKEAPVEGLFYALMHKIMRILDTNRKYEQVKADIERAYDNDDFGEWE